MDRDESNTTITATTNCSLKNHASKKKQQFELGIHGVRLKHFEEVLAKLLPSVRPEYVCLPKVPLNAPSLRAHYKQVSNLGQNSKNDAVPWPFSSLPVSSRVLGNGSGQLSHPNRAARKEGQLQSMLRCIIQLVPPCIEQSNEIQGPFTLVDFGGGSGHLGIPLALLFPECCIIVVDLRKRSLDLMHQKAAVVKEEILQSYPNQRYSLKPPEFVKDSSAFACCGGDGVLENLYSFHGPVETFTAPFDMALALHLCGEATDVAIRKAINVRAPAIVMAPCCVGKLSQKVSNPDIYHATGSNMATVSYPQSPFFCQLVTNQDDWDSLAKAADYSNEQEARTNRNATRRTAKALLETDRRLFLQAQSYKTALMRMDPWEATPKNDILVAWDPTKITTPPGLFTTPDTACDLDLQIAESQLLPPTSNGSNIGTMSSDWTQEEEVTIRNEIQRFLERTDSLDEVHKMEELLVFPTRMGGRKRKLIHFVAGKFDLAHWSVGEKDSEKTVAVARRGQRKTEKSVN